MRNGTTLSLHPVRLDALADALVGQLVDQPRTCGAQLYVAVRDDLGRRRRCPFPLNVIDTDTGRWFMQRQHNAGGQVWVTAAPASPRVVTTTLYDMLRALAGGRQ